MLVVREYEMFAATSWEDGQAQPDPYYTHHFCVHGESRERPQFGDVIARCDVLRGRPDGVQRLYLPDEIATSVEVLRVEPVAKGTCRIRFRLPYLFGIA